MYRLDHKLTRGFAASVAIVAIALNAFWPLIAQLQPGNASMQMEACAEAHMQHGDMGEHDSAPAEPSPLMPHCGFCSLAIGGFVVLVTDRFDPVPFTIDTKESRPTSPEVRPLAFFSFSLAQPRAPPVLS